MSFLPLTKFRKKEFARLAARGPTPEEVARDKAERQKVAPQNAPQQPNDIKPEVRP